MQFYITTDGFFDQNGGEKGFPFGKKRFSTLVEKYQKHTFNEQKDALISDLLSYQDEEERNDDISIIGIKI